MCLLAQGMITAKNQSSENTTTDEISTKIKKRTVSVHLPSMNAFGPFMFILY